MAKKVDWDARLGRRVRLRDIHILIEVAQAGSMARAARSLNISQPAVSDAIANLEHALDVALLERGRRGIELTSYGRALLRSGRAALGELRQGIREIEHMSDPAAGELRIACGDYISSAILGPIVGELTERFPRIHLVVEPFLSSSRPAFPQLDNRDVDLVLTLLSSPLLETVSRLMNVELLFEDRLCLAACKTGAWARRRKIDLSERVNEPWITVPAHDLGAKVLEAAFADRGLKPPHVTVTSYSVSLRTYLAANGRFIAVIPKSMLRAGAETLKELPIDLPMPPWWLAAVTPKDRTLSPLVEPFIQCARPVKVR